MMFLQFYGFAFEMAMFFYLTAEAKNMYWPDAVVLFMFFQVCASSVGKLLDGLTHSIKSESMKSVLVCYLLWAKPYDLPENMYLNIGGYFVFNALLWGMCYMLATSPQQQE